VTLHSEFTIYLLFLLVVVGEVASRMLSFLWYKLTCNI